MIFSFSGSSLVFTLNTSFLEILHPFFLGGSFPYIALSFTSEPSIYTFQGNFLDACPIRILLEVVERVVSCEVTVQISSLMQLVRLLQSIECRNERCLLQETSFLHPCTSCTFPLPSIPLSLGFSGVPVAIWLFNSPQVGVVLGRLFAFICLGWQIYPRIGFLVLDPPIVFIQIYH